ncbi:MAG: hypothetical protein H6Q73_3898 [Firmicutes bacterium]|nr:hypothetical protein [Bacillota bacterium]
MGYWRDRLSDGANYVVAGYNYFTSKWGQGLVQTSFEDNAAGQWISGTGDATPEQTEALRKEQSGESPEVGAYLSQPTAAGKQMTQDEINAAQYDKEWRTIRSDNPNWSDQQVYDEMTRRIGAAWYDQEWRTTQAAHPEWSKEQVDDYMTDRIQEADLKAWNDSYQYIINDIVNSSTPAEMELKIQKYDSRLLAFCASKIKVDNDLKYARNTLRKTQGIEFQYGFSPTNPAFVDAELSYQDRVNGYHLEINDNGVRWRVNAAGHAHPDDLWNYYEQTNYIQKYREGYNRTIKSALEVVKPEINLENNPAVAFGTAFLFAGFTEMQLLNPRTEGVGNIFKGSSKAVKGVKVAAEESSNNYRTTFFTRHPELEGKVVVHHSVEQQVLKRPETMGLFTKKEINAYNNLRGVPKELNSDLHLSTIRKEWNEFYRENPFPSKEDLLAKSREFDMKYGNLFNPPIE